MTIALPQRGCREASSVRRVIEVLGGTNTVAKRFAVDPSAVSHWIDENYIPPRHFPLMRKMLVARKCYAPLRIWGFSGRKLWSK